jgi:hypothetical protein
MTTKIRCYTLFNITKTGVSTRRTPGNLPQEKILEWEISRNKQCNFDTVLQVVSLRTQPEEITDPQQTQIDFAKSENFGFLFEQEEPQHMWYFDFVIHYQNVYNDGIRELGYLFDDCDGVPMIKGLGEWEKLPDFLDSSPELRNIYFEII